MASKRDCCAMPHGGHALQHPCAVTSTCTTKLATCHAYTPRHPSQKQKKALAAVPGNANCKVRGLEPGQQIWKAWTEAGELPPLKTGSVTPAMFLPEFPEVRPSRGQLLSVLLSLIGCLWILPESACLWARRLRRPWSLRPQEKGARAEPQAKEKATANGCVCDTSGLFKSAFSCRNVKQL